MTGAKQEPNITSTISPEVQQHDQRQPAGREREQDQPAEHHDRLPQELRDGPGQGVLDL